MAEINPNDEENTKSHAKGLCSYHVISSMTVLFCVVKFKLGINSLTDYAAIGLVLQTRISVFDFKHFYLSINVVIL